MMARPKRKLFGYSRKQTDLLIKEIKKDYEDELKKKRDRIVELTSDSRRMKDELEQATKEIEKYQEKERYICQAAIRAEEHAQRIIEEANSELKVKTEALMQQEENWKERENEIRQKVVYMNKTFSELLDSFRNQLKRVEQVEKKHYLNNKESISA